MCRECLEDADLAVRCRERRTEAVRRAYLFRELDEATAERLGRDSRELELAAEQTLCLQGEPACEYFLVMSGRLSLLRHSEDGEEYVVALVGEGELFAEELATADEARHPLTARALVATRVAALDRRRLHLLLHEHPQVARALLETVARRNAILLEELERVTIRCARDRLLDFVRGQRSPLADERPLAKRILAAKLAIRPETLSRVVRELKDGRILAEVDGHLQLRGVADGAGSDAACASCPLVAWGCPGPRPRPPFESD